METSFYQKLTNRRRQWEVIKPPKQTVQIGAETTIQKALSLSALECPVGVFIEELIQSHRDLPQPVLNLLQANADDEIKHDKVLANLREAYPVDMEHDVEVDLIVREANRLSLIYSPVLVAGVLEVSVFFVILPMYRFFGSGGFRTIANDISNDENIHVATNIQLAKDLKYDRTTTLDNFRKSIVNWLTADLPEVNDNPKMTRDFWRKSSDNLYYQGKSVELRDTKRSVMQSFFEKSNSSLPIYG